MAQLELRQVSKRFADAHIIRGIDLKIEDGKFCVFVGPSGCGKSTLLRMIAGLEECSDGAILIDRDDVTDHQPARRGIAMVFQSYALYPHMTVQENMGFGLKIAKADPALIQSKVKTAARTLQIEHLLGRRPKDLSGGQRQRVAIGRAIVREPEVFLFDEPLSNLDASLRMDMRMEISKLHQDLGATMIYVTHDQVEAMTLADKIVVLNGGVVQQVGSPLELYHRPANLFVAGFIGSPKMNFIAVKIDAIGAGTVTVSGPDMKAVSVPVATDGLQIGSALTLGTRPHQLLPAEQGAITGTVTLVEHLGNETIVNLRLASGKAVVVGLGGDFQVALGDSLHLNPEVRNAVLFDADGQALPN